MNAGHMRTKCSVTLLLLLLLSLPLMSQERFTDVDLWLPSTYQNHYLHLLEAAEKAQLDPYCKKLLSGGLQESRSKPDYPIFSFVCRTEEGRSFAILVDGKTLKLTNTYVDRQRKIEEAKKAKEQRIQDEKDNENKRIYEDELKTFKHWLVCHKSIKKRLKLFENVEMLAQTPPEPDYDYENSRFHYVVDFNADSPSRKRLHFTVECQISSLDEHTLRIFPRKKA